MPLAPALRALFAVLGLACVAAGFLLGVRSAALASRPPHRRPRWWHRPPARAGFVALRLCLLAVGLAASAAASLLLAALLAAALLAAWARRRWVRGRRYQIAMLRRAFVDLCKQQPGVAREDLLAFLISARHPRWDAEMVAQMVRDHTTVEGLLDALVRLERQVFD